MNKTDFRRLFREAFTTDDKWLDWFMAEVYDETDVLAEEVDGKPVATLLSSRYPMEFHGAELPLAYLSCVATAKSERGKGHMHRLMVKALKESYERGDAFAALIPAERRLYFFYDKFGFATVFYADELRYTALHAFVLGEEFSTVEPSFDMFSRLEALRMGSVRHSGERFTQILADMKLDNGVVRAVTDGNGGEAIAFAQVGDEVKVIELLSSSEAAAEAALAYVRMEAPEKAFVVWAEPTGRKASLRSRGMLRIINAEAVLTALAASNQKIDQVIRVHDPIIAANNGVFVLRKGQCTRASEPVKKYTLDVSVDVLARVIFSSPEIGDVFELPTRRPFISLMLD